MRTNDLDYPLPEDLIAIRPAQPRDAARMMVVRRTSDEITHAIVRDLPGFLRRGDAMIVNDTAVVPARFTAVRTDSGGRIGGLYLDEPQPGLWRVMLRSGGRLKPGNRLLLSDGATGEPTDHQIELREKDGSTWTVALLSTVPGHAVLDAIGLTPLPPYILKARRDRPDALQSGENVPIENAPWRIVEDDQADRVWYQTVYADPAKRRSIAAPTAGLHFTPQLLAAVESAGVRRLGVTLDVGLGTFGPVNEESIDEHRMHAERYIVPRATLEGITAAREAGRRGVAVGTTTVRALESIDYATAHLRPAGLTAERGALFAGSTELLIQPPFEFRWVDALLTNFHLPRSTLLALVAAFMGLEQVKRCYAIAVECRYRFYSFGDCMLILP